MRGDIQLSGSRWAVGPTYFTEPDDILETSDHASVREVIDAACRHALSGKWVAGYISYQAAPGINPDVIVPRRARLPLVWLGTYDAKGSPPGGKTGRFRLGDWSAGMSPAAHGARVESVKKAIRDGLTYQVNLTFPMTTFFEGDPVALFSAMMRAQPSAYGAYLDLGRQRVMSVSPELYLETRGRRIRTKPMKGTAPRGRHTLEDLQQAEMLRASAKEQASNVMVVDLLRNDLGRIAEQGTVQVTGLFETERHPTVWQLTSTIEALARDDVGWPDILEATFPSGSVTGAPKISTMRLIAEHESEPRDVYCGAIGYLAPGLESSELSVAIRTGVVADGNFTYHAGGGITADSIAEVEYEECLWKARVVTQSRHVPDLIETMSFHPERGIPLLRRHLERLTESAAYWGIPCDPNRVQTSLERIEATEEATVRLTLRANGSIEVETRPKPPSDEPVWLTVCQTVVVDPSQPLWYHKTAERSRYPATEEGVEAILVNERDEVTETNISSIMARFGERWVTPALDSGCLPGVYRSKVLGDGIVSEATLTLEDLHAADELAVTNAVRGWRKAVLSD